MQVTPAPPVPWVARARGPTSEHTRSPGPSAGPLGLAGSRLPTFAGPARPGLASSPPGRQPHFLIPCIVLAQNPGAPHAGGDREEGRGRSWGQRMRRKRRRRRRTASSPAPGQPVEVWRRPGPRQRVPPAATFLGDEAFFPGPRAARPPARSLLRWQVPPSLRLRPGEPGSQAPRSRALGRAAPGGADTHRDDGGALAPLPPVSLSLELPRRAPAAASAASAAPAASLRPRRPGSAPQPRWLRVRRAGGAGGARGRGGRRQPLPGKYRSPRAPECRRRGPARPGAEGGGGGEAGRRVAAAAGRFFPTRIFVNLTKWRALRSCAASSAGARAAAAAAAAPPGEPGPPAPDPAQTLAHTHRAHTRPRTRSLTLTPVPPARRRRRRRQRQRHQQQQQEQQHKRRRRWRPHPRSGSPLSQPDLGRDRQQRRQQSPRIPPPRLPPPPPPHSNGAFYYYSGGKRKGLKKNQPTKWRRTDPVAIATVNQNAKPRLTC
jgi:hypothetical protein